MKIKLIDVRLSFPDLFVPVQFQGTGPFNYKCSFLFAPNSQAAKDVDAAVKAVAKEAWAARAETILSSIKNNSMKCCFIEGDMKEYDGYAGNLVLAAGRGEDKGRPLVIDTNKSPLTASDGKPYGGCYVDAVVEIWAQDNGHGKAIRATLNGVQFRRDGDRFSGGEPASVDDFEDLTTNEFADDLV